MGITYIDQPLVLEANTVVLADKVYWSSWPSDSYCSDLSSTGYYFRLDSYGHGFSGVYKFQGKEILNFFSLGNNFFISH